MINLFPDNFNNNSFDDKKISAGKFTIFLPDTLGFCGGVRRALQKLQEVLDGNSTGKICLLGEIIHNNTVNNYFLSKGVEIVKKSEYANLFSSANPADTIIIPAFGVPIDLDKKLRNLEKQGINLIDTTCIYVQRIWDFAYEQASTGATVIIHGKPHHPETLATISRITTTGATAVVVPNLSAATSLANSIRIKVDIPPTSDVVLSGKINYAQHFALVNQTTMLYSETIAIEKLLADAITSINGKIELSRTVCRATQNRQDAALELCKKGCDMFIVIGGYSSSNTSQLYRLAKEHATTYFIRDATALHGDKIITYLPSSQQEVVIKKWLPRDTAKIAILAGASCPSSDIQAVINRLQQLENANFAK